MNTGFCLLGGIGLAMVATALTDSGPRDWIAWGAEHLSGGQGQRPEQPARQPARSERAAGQASATPAGATR